MGWFTDNFSSWGLTNVLMGLLDSAVDALHVGPGPSKFVRVPDVVGKTLPEARDACYEAGLSVHTVGASRSSEGVGTVVSQSLDPDEKVPRSSKVTLSLEFKKSTP
jgi:beta-lactam-binding protein with PASTA domain